jgi:hypothetical protein
MPLVPAVVVVTHLREIEIGGCAKDGVDTIGGREPERYILFGMKVGEVLVGLLDIVSNSSGDLTRFLER